MCSGSGLGQTDKVEIVGEQNTGDARGRCKEGRMRIGAELSRRIWAYRTAACEGSKYEAHTRVEKREKETLGFNINSFKT